MGNELPLEAGYSEKKKQATSHSKLLSLGCGRMTNSLGPIRYLCTDLGTTRTRCVLFEKKEALFWKVWSDYGGRKARLRKLLFLNRWCEKRVLLLQVIPESWFCSVFRWDSVSSALSWRFCRVNYWNLEPVRRAGARAREIERWESSSQSRSTGGGTFSRQLSSALSSVQFSLCHRL